MFCYTGAMATKLKKRKPRTAKRPTVNPQDVEDVLSELRRLMLDAQSWTCDFHRPTRPAEPDDPGFDPESPFHAIAEGRETFVRIEIQHKRHR